ncbi:EamA family transporter [Aquisediminimonas profunda]|uniref:EamA family transporter n=1 Tax=Aquisediminimonas profunda TaxID=1550733 RepID=UPI001FEA7E63|nr:EamA family transporter [Aquisediminimonas profunda]
MSRIQKAAMPLSHFSLALAVMAVWGSNFVVIKTALQHLTPLLLAALRFTFAFFPLAFFLKRPAVSLGNLASYGLLIGVGQFGLLFIAMRHDITPGLASLVVQVQVFFTIGFSMRMTGEHVHRFQFVALLLAIAGIGMIATHAEGSATALGLFLVIGAAMSWAGGNIVSRAAGQVNMLSYVVWASIFAVPPLFLLSFLFEGWPAMQAGVQDADMMTWAAVLWQSVGNTMFGYAAWGWLLSRHPAATITPMALLVPVFGIGASALLLGEALPAWKLLAAALVMSGLAVGLLWPRYTAMRRFQ